MHDASKDIPVDGDMDDDELDAITSQLNGASTSAGKRAVLQNVFCKAKRTRQG